MQKDTSGGDGHWLGVDDHPCHLIRIRSVDANSMGTAKIGRTGCARTMVVFTFV